MRRYAAAVLALATGLALSHAAGAGELRELYLGARSLAMGGAYVGLGDDEQAVFLNPAGLAGSKKYSFHYGVADIQTSADVVGVVASGGTSALGNLADISSSVDILMGKNIFARGQSAPTLLIPHFGIGAIVDGQFGVLANNPAQPQFTLITQITSGVQAALGIPVFSINKGRDEFRLGIGAKVLWRRGGYRELTLSDLVALSKDTLSTAQGGIGMGIGGDLGMQYIHKFNKAMSLSFGAAYTELGDITFVGGNPDMQKGNASFGFAFKYDKEFFHIIVAYDYKHFIERTDWRKKNHLGIEIMLPFPPKMRLMAGINQVYPTYGASFDLWIFQVTALSYAEELGSFAYQIGDRRYLAHIDLKFDL